MWGESKGVNLGSLEAVVRVKVLMLENPEVVLGGGLECGKSAGVMIFGVRSECRDDLHACQGTGIGFMCAWK